MVLIMVVEINRTAYGGRASRVEARRVCETGAVDGQCEWCLKFQPVIAFASEGQFRLPPASPSHA